MGRVLSSVFLLGIFLAFFGGLSDASTYRGVIVVGASPDGGVWYQDIKADAGGIQAEQWQLSVAANLPRRGLVVSFQTCDGTPNAWYSPTTHDVTMCYDLLWQAWTRLDTRDDVWAFTRFVLAHEVGHATVDIRALNLPGLEESNADQFAAVALLDHGDADAVMAAVAYWQGISVGDLRDTHPVGAQRAANLACLALGSGQLDLASAAVVQAGLGGRAYWCDEEWAHASAFWRSIR